MRLMCTISMISLHKHVLSAAATRHLHVLLSPLMQMLMLASAINMGARTALD